MARGGQTRCRGWWRSATSLALLSHSQCLLPLKAHQLDLEGLVSQRFDGRRMSGWVGVWVYKAGLVF